MTFSRGYSAWVFEQVWLPPGVNGPRGQGKDVTGEDQFQGSSRLKNIT